MNNLQNIIRLTRPKQWFKNILVLFGLFFSGNFLYTEAVKSASVAVISFVFASGAVYIFNDIMDREKDRAHPHKCLRPIACGTVSINQALVGLGLLSTVAVSLAWLISGAFFIVILIYFATNLLYSLALKNYPITDVFFLSSGYLLRILGGVLAVNELPTIWFVISIGFSALFIGFSKRRGELVKLGDAAADHRKSLAAYSREFLDAMILINAGIAIATYLLFVIVSSREHQMMIVTVPFIAFAVYRYIFLVFTSDQADSPETLLMDKSLLINNLIWMILFVLTKLDYLGIFHMFKLE